MVLAYVHMAGPYMEEVDQAESEAASDSIREAVPLFLGHSGASCTDRRGKWAACVQEEAAEEEGFSSSFLSQWRNPPR